ncbi:MAG: GumC family protein, partial [Phyllobacteriaceae bacterium]|nr:GumC family protein [Phyllobacteriaceae bacterium]
MPSVQPGPTSATVEPATATPPHVLSEFVRVVRARARTVVAIAVVVAVAVMIGWMLWPTKYKAVALVALDPQAPRLVADQASGGGNGDASTVVSYAEVATSDGFLIPIAKDQKLADDPEFAGGGDGIGDVLIELRRNLKVTRRGLTYLIDVSFTSKDPDKAARIANAVADEIVRRQQALRREANAGISDALRSRLADLRAAVLASEKAVADYRQKNDLLDVSPDGRVGLKRLNSLTEQIGPIRARLEDARARWDKLRKAKSVEDADPSIFRSDRLTELLSRLGEEKRQMASATQTYGPRHPSVEAAQARIASIETAIRDERARIVDQVKAEVDVLTEQNAAYEKEIAKRTSEQLAADQKEVVLQDLVRQAQADRQIYEQFLARQKTTQEQGDMSQPEAVVVSSATPPTRPTRPGLTLAALVGLLGGLGTGLMWVLFGPPPARRVTPLVAPPPAPIAPPNDPTPPAPRP